MDEAFVELPGLLAGLTAMPEEFTDQDAGVRTYVRAFEVESPIELDVWRGADGKLRLGTVPPMYRVDTTFRPSYHNIRIAADCDRVTGEERADG